MHPFLHFVLVVIAVMIAASRPTPLHAQQTTPEPDTVGLLSAFFGLDNALPFGANGLCLGARGRDGMPVIFSQVIDPDTLQANDFAVITASGIVSTPFCVTLSPAIDNGELRTVLLIGEFGSAESDPPARVEVVGEILASGGTGDTPTAANADSPNFLGAVVAVTPLSAGPTMIVAEIVPETQWTPDQTAGRQRGDGCPSSGTVQIVRVTWAGGVSNEAGDEAGDRERSVYRVTMRAADGTDIEIAPFALADLGDGDNNHLLCLDSTDLPVAVFFPAGYLFDPNADAPNPDSTVMITGVTE